MWDEFPFMIRYGKALKANIDRRIAKFIQFFLINHEREANWLNLFYFFSFPFKLQFSYCSCFILISIVLYSLLYWLKRCEPK